MPTLPDNKKQELIVDHSLGMSERKLETKYLISRKQVRKIIKTPNMKDKRNQLMNLKTREVAVKKELALIDAEKDTSLTLPEKKALDGQIYQELRYWERTTSGLMKGQELTDLAADKLLKMVKDNPDKILESLNKRDFMELSTMIMKNYSLSQASIHGKSSINVQQNAQLNNEPQVVVILPDNGRG